MNWEVTSGGQVPAFERLRSGRGADQVRVLLASERSFVISLRVAEGIFFVCTNCGKEIVSWDEGNPYYRDPDGAKHYAYHPDSMRAFCVGNDSPHLCLNCGAEFSVDSEEPCRDCPQCHSTEISDSFALDRKPCPFCKQVKFIRDLSRQIIS